MPRRTNAVNVNIQMPRWLRDEITLILIDPATGRVPHGRWSLFIEEALVLKLRAMKPAELVNA